uniref:apoptosis-associated speck-like protein containing a CARD isoform X2 n=1 Tax=Monopterus albus TaxID=43700 RepID=UPI0009B3C5A5|nr:uncharacterized protein LOC109953190 isoform X2 [Monopterus albus]
MVRRTIEAAILEVLEDLSKNDFDRFCHRLRDRREVLSVDVEGKNRLEITDLVVSASTKSQAPKVAMEVLRQINCNEMAERLDSKTKACLDTGDPTFRKTSDGKLDLTRTQEARNRAASRRLFRAGRHGCPPAVKKPKEVEAEAKALVLSEGGDPDNDRLVLSRYKIQFGQYYGQCFKWLLENDLSYAVYIVANHLERLKCSSSESPLMANKDSLTQYAIAYTEIEQQVRLKPAYAKAKDRSLQPRQKGKALLDFGKYKSETLQDLYESQDAVKVSYVNFLRSMKSTCTPGSKMEDAIKYILQRDQKKAATATKRRTTNSGRGAAKRSRQRKQNRS